MDDTQVSEGGVFAAVFLALIGTAGAFLTQGRAPAELEWLWLGVFALSLLTLSAAVVNFDFRRIIK